MQIIEISQRKLAKGLYFIIQFQKCVNYSTTIDKLNISKMAGISALPFFLSLSLSLSLSLNYVPPFSLFVPVNLSEFPDPNLRGTLIHTFNARWPTPFVVMLKCLKRFF